MDQKKMWKHCVAFHGHECGGLTIGYKASLYAIRLLEITMHEDAHGCLSPDEQLVCIAENDACGVDAVQALLGCSVGKGNLLFHTRGKQAFSFYNRSNGKSVRLVLKPRPEGMSREESFAWLQEREPEDLFEVKETKLAVPEQARIFRSLVCSRCGEIVSENMIRLQNGETLCLDCADEYDRFRV